MTHSHTSPVASSQSAVGAQGAKVYKRPSDRDVQRRIIRLRRRVAARADALGKRTEAMQVWAETIGIGFKRQVRLDHPAVGGTPARAPELSPSEELIALQNLLIQEDAIEKCLVSIEKDAATRGYKCPE
jgi:hypothetical protein